MNQTDTDNVTNALVGLLQKYPSLQLRDVFDCFVGTGFLTIDESREVIDHIITPVTYSYS